MSHTRPPIILIDTEADALFNLALAARGKSQMGADLMLEELERANSCKRADMPRDVVTMMSHVVFADEGTGEQHEVQLVYPKMADAQHRRISATTPIGAGLIGMRQGDTIEWPNRSGISRRLTILEVSSPVAEA